MVSLLNLDAKKASDQLSHQHLDILYTGNTPAEVPICQTADQTLLLCYLLSNTLTAVRVVWLHPDSYLEHPLGVAGLYLAHFQQQFICVHSLNLPMHAQ